MKNIFKDILAATLLLVAAACSEQYENCSVQDTDENLVEVSFYADLGPAPVKTTYTGGVVAWEKTDEINIFSGEQWTKTDAAISSLSENKKSAVFTGLAAEGSGTYCAVYPKAETNSFDGTALNVTIPSEQTAVATGFQSGANVAVSYTSTNAFTFKNIGALIGFRFKTERDAAKTASVTFKARTSEDDAETAVYYGLSGSTNVVFDENGVPAAGEGDEKSVTLKAPEGGFVATTTYYVVVLPGNYKGFDITYTPKEGTPVSWSNDMDYDLLRNDVMNIGQLNEPYPLPDVITISLDFTTSKWPFSQTVLATSSQDPAGDTYTYKYSYTYKETKMSTEFEFVFCKGTGTGYTHNYNGTAKARRFIPSGTADAWIQLPGIDGRYLKSVSMSHGNLYEKRFKLQRKFDDGLAFYNSPKKVATAADKPVETAIVFPTTDTDFGNLKTTSLGGSYCMLFVEASAQISNITLVYTKDAPVAETPETTEPTPKV